MEPFAETIRKGFAGKRVVVVGDPVADQFLRGTIGRVSREAPVFILRHDETETLPGGAANAAANVASLGGEAVLVGVIGMDQNGERLTEALRSKGVETGFLVGVEGRETTTKVRVLAGQHYAPRQQVIRIDYEAAEQIGDEAEATLLSSISEAVGGADALILSDYSYGTATRLVAGTCAEVARERGIPLIVDSRTRLLEFAGATSATPNQEEVEQILGSGFTDSDCEGLRERLGLEALLVTRGNKGMLLIEKGGGLLEIPAVGSSEPVDVTGAGDTVIAAYALGLASGLGFADAARLANHAGSVVVMKRGTATASLREIERLVEDTSESGSEASSA
jgi:rfaE bifunctional protein kinase chain/domain